MHASAPKKGMWLRFMPEGGNYAELINRSGEERGDVLEEPFYCWEKHVGRFPKRHVPGVGYHQVPC